METPPAVNAVSRSGGHFRMCHHRRNVRQRPSKGERENEDAGRAEDRSDIPKSSSSDCGVRNTSSTGAFTALSRPRDESRTGIYHLRGCATARIAADGGTTLPRHRRVEVEGALRRAK